MIRTIIYGDLHGCLDEFRLLRDKVNPTKNDKEIIIGDIFQKSSKTNPIILDKK